MAASDASLDPGLFMLPLLINKDSNIDKLVLMETKLRELGHFLKVRSGRSEEPAILNFQGLLTLRLGRHEDAVDCFQAVLKRDPENLNALANLQYVLETSVKGDLERRNARCLAEKAYAYANDIHGVTTARDRYKESNKLYRKALDLGQTAVKSEEKDDWKFFMAVNAHKLFDVLIYELGKTPEVIEYCFIAVDGFFDITQRDQVDTELQWDSWCNLADLFGKIKTKKIQRVVSLELQEFKDNPEKCMRKAMEVSPGNAMLLARYANFLDKNNLGKPLELLEQSISLDSSEFNFHAFSTRAMINIKLYEIQIVSSGEDDSNRSALRDTLQLAQTDLEKVILMHVTPRDLARLGNVYYLLAKYHTKQDIQIRSLIEKALLYFDKAVNCQDGNKRCAVHILKGRCLFDIGENRAAVACYTQVIDCESSTGRYTGNFNELLNVYLSMLRDNENTEDKSKLADEIADSLQKALLKYKKSNMIKYCISIYRLEYKNELQQLEKYCKKFEKFREVTSLLNTYWEAPKLSQEGPITKGGTLRQSWNKTQVSAEEHTREDPTAPRE